MKVVREYETLLDKEAEENDAQEALKKLDAFLFTRDERGEYVIGKKGKKQINWTNVVFQVWRLIFLITAFLECLTKPDKPEEKPVATPKEKPIETPSDDDAKPGTSTEKEPNKSKKKDK